MQMIRSLTTLAGLSCVAGALAHGPGLPRYQVSEIHAPPSVRADCLPELAQSALGASINDFGIVSANFVCYTQFDPNGPFPSASNGYSTFVGAPWLSSFELPASATNAHAYSYQINNLGQVFGTDIAPRSEEHTSELQSQSNLVCRLLLE